MSNITDKLNDEMIDAHMRPFIIVADDCYERMMFKLKNGERFVKSFTDMVCPHKDPEKDCDCKYKINFLQDGSIVRYNFGVKQTIIPCWLAKYYSS